MSEILDKLINDMREHGDQSSWDWEADERFAWIVGDTEAAEIIREAINSASVTMHRWKAVQITGIPKKRMAALRKLQKQGYVRGYWRGLGSGGRNEFGVGRVRGYELLTPRKQAA